MTRLAWAIGGCLLLVGGAAPLVAIAQSPPRPYAEALRDCGVFWWQSRGTSRTSPIALGIAKGHVPDREVTPLAGEIPERFIPRRCRPP